MVDTCFLPADGLVLVGGVLRREAAEAALVDDVIEARRLGRPEQKRREAAGGRVEAKQAPVAL